MKILGKRILCSWLAVCLIPASMAVEELVKDNFESQPEMRWSYFSDQVMGGVSKYGERSVNMVEQWKTLSTETTIFDGLWKLEKRSSDKDDWTGFSEMKLIGGGHYIFFQSLVVESQPVKHFAFGSFDVTDSGEALETGITSSIEGYGGSEYLLNMQLTDDNHLTQTFELDGAIVTHTYVRI